MRKRGAACWKDWRAPDCPADTASAGRSVVPEGCGLPLELAHADRQRGRAAEQGRLRRPAGAERLEPDPLVAAAAADLRGGEPSPVAPEWLRAGAHLGHSCCAVDFPKADLAR